MDTGKHVKASEYESVYDSAKKMWAERVTEVNLVSSGEVDSSVDTVQSEPSQYSAKKGWALKSTKRGNRMGENVRSFQGQLETPGHQNRRKTFVDPLVNYAKLCSCQEL